MTIVTESRVPGESFAAAPSRDGALRPTIFLHGPRATAIGKTVPFCRRDGHLEVPSRTIRISA